MKIIIAVHKYEYCISWYEFKPVYLKPDNHGIETVLIPK